MEFNTDTTTIKDFLQSNKFSIPRYQREYSWEKEQLEDFYLDIVSNIGKNEEGFKNQDYFFGTVILVGEMKKHDVAIEIIDGQQRITTITIFLSVLSDILFEHDQKLSNLLWRYVISEDDNGEKYNVMENETAYPYFQKKVQTRNLQEAPQSIQDEYLLTDHNEINELEKELTVEGQNIKNAYDFFKSKLEDENLSAEVFKDSEISRLQKLKIVRDQLLGSTFIYIISKNVEDVNKIFENINSKGLRLSSVDLIKNEIFSVQNKTVPMDVAKQLWAETKGYLASNGRYIPLQKFYRYFWLSRYTNSSEKDLYKKFKDKIKPEQYEEFLKEMKNSANVFSNVINPNEDYFRERSKGNGVSKEDLAEFIRALESIQNVLNIEQIRILLITLVEKYKNGKIRFKNLKKIIVFLEEFHFIYNGILTGRTNTLVQKYGSAAREIYSTDDASEINEKLMNLKNDFIELVKDNSPKFNEKFCRLSYSSKSAKKGQQKESLLTKYAVYKYEELLSKRENATFNREAATIEHILPESTKLVNDKVNNIGNLFILERKINLDCDAKELTDKIVLYRDSTYKTVQDFLEKYSNYNEDFINQRALEMAETMYSMITNSWMN